MVYSGEVGYQTPQVTYTYDEPRNDANQNPYYNNGRLTKVRTAASTNEETPETVQTYDYDKVGQVVNHTQSIGNQSYNLQYGYNLAGQLVSEKYPSGKVFNFAVDAAGRLCPTDIFPKRAARLDYNRIADYNFDYRLTACD